MPLALGRKPTVAENCAGSPLNMIVFLLMATALATGCSSLGSSGPATGAILHSADASVQGTNLRILDVNDTIASQLAYSARAPLFSDVFGDVPAVGTSIQKGDIINVTVWETPPAVLFGMIGGGEMSGSSAKTAMAVNSEMPPQMVDENGLVSLPFVGVINAANRTPRMLEQEIKQRLTGIANAPQVLVGITRNASANVTVIGEVRSSARVPLTPRGERLLDVIASVGGVNQEVDKITIQITRADRVATMPMDMLIRDPLQNVRLKPDDIVTAIFQPFSFTALGATGRNAEIPFEAAGLTLSQALGRMSGLQDNRANVRGAFIFRWEDPSALDPTLLAGSRARVDGKVPIIYRVDLSEPATLFVAQNFPIRDNDIVYVSNAPGVDFQKFLSVLSQTAFSVIGLTNAVTQN